MKSGIDIRTYCEKAATSQVVVAKSETVTCTECHIQCVLVCSSFLCRRHSVLQAKTEYHAENIDERQNAFGLGKSRLRLD